MRTRSEVCKAISEMTDVERAGTHAQVEAMDVSDKRKAELHTFLMFLDLAGGKSTKQ